MSLEKQEFIKAENDNLYTAITHYDNGHSNITFIASMHVGKIDYYEAIQQEIDKHEIGLYEGLKPMQKNAKLPPIKLNYADLYDILQSNFRKMADYMGEEYCLHRKKIKYGKSWEHIDMTVDDFLIKLPNRVLGDFYTRLKGSNEFLDNVYRNYPDDASERIRSIVIRPYTPLGKILEDRSEYYYGENQNKDDTNKVVVVERNKIVCKALNKKLEEGREDIAIVYGASHMEGLEEFIGRKGFKESGKLWLCGIEG